MPKITQETRTAIRGLVTKCAGEIQLSEKKYNKQKSVAHPQVSETLRKPELHMHKKSIDSQEVSESSEVHYIGERSKKGLITCCKVCMVVADEEIE